MSKAHFWFQIGLVVEKWLRIQKGSVTNGNGVPLIESQGEAQGVVLAPMGPNLRDEGSWQLQPGRKAHPLTQVRRGKGFSWVQRKERC